MPALPRELSEKFVRDYGLPLYDAHVITESRDVAIYFEDVCQWTHNYKSVSNWVMGPVKSYLKDFNLTADEFPLKPATLAQVIDLVEAGVISYTMAVQRLFPEILKHPGKNAMEVAQQLNLLQESDSDSLMPIIEEVIKEFPLKVEEYKKGKKGIVTMFMGEVMRRSKGKADPKVASELLARKLHEA